MMWSGAGLNRRHQDFQSCALPTELPLHFFKRRKYINYYLSAKLQINIRLAPINFYVIYGIMITHILVILDNLEKKFNSYHKNQ